MPALGDWVPGPHWSVYRDDTSACRTTMAKSSCPQKRLTLRCGSRTVRVVDQMGTALPSGFAHFLPTWPASESCPSKSSPCGKLDHSQEAEKGTLEGQGEKRQRTGSWSGRANKRPSPSSGHRWPSVGCQSPSHSVAPLLPRRSFFAVRATSPAACALSEATLLQLDLVPHRRSSRAHRSSRL